VVQVITTAPKSKAYEIWDKQARLVHDLLAPRLPQRFGAKLTIGCGCLVAVFSVALAISRLRRKLEDDPSRPKYVLTVYGVGYRFAEEPE